MRRKLALMAAGLLVAGGGAVASFAASSAAAATTITVIEHTVTDKVIDVGKKGDSPGDLLTFHNKVYDEADATVAGDDQGYCVRISPKKGTWECVYTVFLEDGQLTVETPFYDTADSVGTVTGGTGTYASASGSIDLHCYVGDDEIARCDFTFNLA
jgi:allene oxide cyclase